jgi:ATP-binding cassette subfamily F protein 3
VFVSHHRAFANALATHVWDVRDGGVVPYPGTLDEYLERQRRLEAEQGGGEEVGAGAGGGGGNGAMTAKDRRRLEAEERQRRSAVEGPLKRKVAELEARIAALETRAKEEQDRLAEPSLYQDFEKARPLMDAHRATKAELEGLYAEWEAASAKLEAARSG